MSKTKTQTLSPNQHRGLDHTVVHFKARFANELTSARVLSVKGRTRIELTTSATWTRAYDGEVMQEEVEAAETFEGQAVRRFIKAFESMLRLVRDAGRADRKAAKETARQTEIQTGEAGTCPCCFGTYSVGLASDGTRAESMVHHGFKRPGYGYTIGQCFGKGYEPFEVSCKGTKDLVVALRRNLVGLVSYHADLVAGKITELTVERWAGKMQLVKVGDASWGYTLTSSTHEAARRVRDTESAIADLDARIAAWKATR